LISPDKLLTMYAAMVKCRQIAPQTARVLHPKGAGCTCKTAAGWEAIIAGVIVDLLPGDRLSAPQNKRIQAILCAIQADRALSLLASSARGKHDAADATEQEAHSSHADEAFDAEYRAARAFMTARNGKVVVVFSEGPCIADSWRTRFPDVARRNLPLLIVSHRGPSSGDTLHSDQHKTHRNAPEALASGVPVITVDGNDAQAVYRVSSESIFRARQRRGPTLIECIAPITTSLNGQPVQDRRQPAIADPILTMEAYLAEKGIPTPALQREID
jgi:TPP-dependent pyruvate/acetoin dehydrogenase alpha subunit